MVYKEWSPVAPHDSEKDHRKSLDSDCFSTALLDEDRFRTRFLWPWEKFGGFYTEMGAPACIVLAVIHGYTEQRPPCCVVCCLLQLCAICVAVRHVPYKGMPQTVGCACVHVACNCKSAEAVCAVSTVATSCTVCVIYRIVVCAAVLHAGTAIQLTAAFFYEARSRQTLIARKTPYFVQRNVQEIPPPLLKNLPASGSFSPRRRPMRNGFRTVPTAFTHEFVFALYESNPHPGQYMVKGCNRRKYSG